MDLQLLLLAVHTIHASKQSWNGLIYLCLFVYLNILTIVTCFQFVPPKITCIRIDVSSTYFCRCWPWHIFLWWNAVVILADVACVIVLLVLSIIKGDHLLLLLGGQQFCLIRSSLERKVRFKDWLQNVPAWAFCALEYEFWSLWICVLFWIL